MAKIYDLENLTEKYLVTDSPTVASRKFRIAGFATKKNGEDFYTLRLKAFYKTPFFISPNWKGTSDFLVFSGTKKRPNRSQKFFHSVGVANFLNGRDYLVVDLPDLPLTYFLKLEPEEYHFAEAPALRAI